MQRKPALLLVGNFLSAAVGNRSVTEDLAERLRELKYDLIPVSPYRNGFIRGLHMLATALVQRRKYNISLIELFSGKAFLWGEGLCLALRMISKPYILTLHGGDLPVFAKRWPRRMRRALNSAAAVTAPSDYLYEQMKPYRENLRLLPNPLDLCAYKFTRREQPRPRLVWLRAFHEIYNPSLAPRVMSLLTKDFPSIHLTMIGPDKRDGSLQVMKQVAQSLGVTNRITLPGGVPKAEVSDRLNKGDIFLNTTNVDNTPVSVLEAMACGLCVVSTNVGGIPHLLEHERDALLVPPNDPEAMSTAVRRILTEPGLAERLSRNARAKAEQFDWSIILPQWEELLTAVTEKRER